MLFSQVVHDLKVNMPGYTYTHTGSDATLTLYDNSDEWEHENEDMNTDGIRQHRASTSCLSQVLVRRVQQRQREKGRHGGTESQIFTRN